MHPTPNSDWLIQRKTILQLFTKLLMLFFNVFSDINTLCSGAVPSDLPDSTLAKKTHLYFTSMKNYKPGLLLPWLLLWNEPHFCIHALLTIMNYGISPSSPFVFSLMILAPCIFP